MTRAAQTAARRITVWHSVALTPAPHRFCLIALLKLSLRGHGSVCIVYRCRRGTRRYAMLVVVTCVDFRGSQMCVLRANGAVPQHHPFLRGQSLQPDRSPRM